MRLNHLIIWDMKFQSKYGFYFLYTVLTVIYIFALIAMPQSWRHQIAVFLILFDPAAMGLFFMGAIVLLEKSQKIPCALAVSPIQTKEYVMAKVVSLAIISVVVAIILAVASEFPHLILVAIGTLIASILFTLGGIIAACYINSLNQFILYIVPIEVIGLLPVIVYFFNGGLSWLQYYPTNVCLDLIMGKIPSLLAMGFTFLSILTLFLLASRIVAKEWKKLGGVKL